MANPYLETYPQLLGDFIPGVEALKERLCRHGFTLYGCEPLKITIAPKAYGYTGDELGDVLRSSGMEPEFSDRDHLVLMLTPDVKGSDLTRVGDVLCGIERREPITDVPPHFSSARSALSIRDALLSPSETLPIDECLGRILAVPTVGCPPAVPILVCGEVIDSHALSCFRYYGVETCCVVKNR